LAADLAVLYAALDLDLEATFGTGLRAAADSESTPGLRTVLKVLAVVAVAADDGIDARGV
jgi:hypothetical protein